MILNQIFAWCYNTGMKKQSNSNLLRFQNVTMCLGRPTRIQLEQAEERLCLLTYALGERDACWHPLGVTPPTATVKGLLSMNV